MKYQIAWRIKNTTLLHFSPKFFEDRKEADELIEGLSLEHPKYDHGVQECDDAGHHLGIVCSLENHPSQHFQKHASLVKLRWERWRALKLFLTHRRFFGSRCGFRKSRAILVPGRLI